MPQVPPDAMDAAVVAGLPGASGLSRTQDCVAFLRQHV
jgi:hypothetical protein